MNIKYIPIGLQCSVPDGLKKAGISQKTYPFDNLWTPSKTTYSILKILLEDGVEKAIEYMTTGYSYYKYMKNESYESADIVTECQMNPETGLGITHYTINDEYKETLRRRLTRLLDDIKSDAFLLFIYGDAASPSLNYRIDNVVYGTDASEYLEKIYDLIHPLNHKLKILYFCWEERVKANNNRIIYIGYSYKYWWSQVGDIIGHVLKNIKFG